MGASVGLIPSEVFNSEFWMINRFIIGYDQKIKNEQANIIKVAYNTAAFMNSKRKPKPLKHYIDKILNTKYNKISIEESQKRIAWAKEMDEKVSKIKRESEVEINGR